MQRYELSAHTITSKLSSYGKHVRPIIGSMDMATLTYPILQSILNGMIKSGYAVKTAAHVRDIIRTTFMHALRCEYIAKNPSSLLILKRIDNRRFLQLNSTEIVRFVSAVKNESSLFDRCLFMFLLHGRRLNEARQLQWNWIDFDKKTVTIPALHSKDNNLHVYGLIDDFLENLMFLPRQSEYVFVSSVTGCPFVDIRRPFKRILKRAEIDKKRMRIHDIRHLVGTAAIAAGKSLEDVKYALGHNSITTTMRYVTHGTKQSHAVSSLVFDLSIKGVVNP